MRVKPQLEKSEGPSAVASLRPPKPKVKIQSLPLLLAKAGAPPADAWSDDQLAEMRTQVADVPAERIVGTLRAFGQADLRADPLSPLPLELALATSILGAEPRTAAPAAPPRVAALARAR